MSRSRSLAYDDAAVVLKEQLSGANPNVRDEALNVLKSAYRRSDESVMAYTTAVIEDFGQWYDDNYGSLRVPQQGTANERPDDIPEDAIYVDLTREPSSQPNQHIPLEQRDDESVTTAFLTAHATAHHIHNRR